jgi:hypothetical protein
MKYILTLSLIFASLVSGLAQTKTLSTGTGNQILVGRGTNGEDFWQDATNKTQIALAVDSGTMTALTVTGTLTAGTVNATALQQSGTALGTAAFTASSDYATYAQGATADATAARLAGSGTLTVATSGTAATLSGTQTLTNKTIDSGTSTGVWTHTGTTNTPTSNVFQIGGSTEWTMTSAGISATGANTISFPTNSLSLQLIFGSGATSAGINQAAANTLSFNVGSAATALTLNSTLSIFQLGTGWIFTPINLGSATAATYTFNGDNNTGMYSGGADQLDFTTGGTRRGGFNASGNFDTSGSATVVGTLSVGGGATVASFLSATATLDFPSTAAGTASDLTITVTGAALGDTVSVGAPNGSVTTNGGYWGWVSASNTVTVRYMNTNLVTTEDPASGTFRATIVKF